MIDASGERLEDMSDSIAVKLSLIKEDSRKMSERVNALDGTVQSLAPAVQSADHRLTLLEVQTRACLLGWMIRRGRAAGTMSELVELLDRVEDGSMFAFLED
ncbi:hypothetical protein NDU88_001611 [Pleurodeles waltl]|uniref:Uncharacterized protein n=1 Tax=Pleurodeles waltl TaxID=8319 RepID=A0AAV7S9F3_PLEWA|nr:hypothetical protein NDU88_001611 [Pleurodeles waltl]